MVQGVKNLTATARVTVEVPIPSPAQPSGLKDSVWLRLGFNLWPGNFHVPEVGPFNKKKLPFT